MIMRIVELHDCEISDYLHKHGRHFSKNACEFAVSLMKNHQGKIEYKSKEYVDEMLKRNNITLDHNRCYDYVYVANMCFADFYGKSIEDEKHLCMMVKDIVDDYDQREGFIFNRWLSDMDTNGEEIDFEKLT